MSETIADELLISDSDAQLFPGLSEIPVKKRKRHRNSSAKEEAIQKFIYSCFQKKQKEELHHNNRKIGKMLTLIGYDELFERSLANGAKIVNEDLMVSKSVAEEINNAIFSNNDGDLGFTATCECGALKGNYYEGAICPKCKTKVSTAFADKLTHTCWIAIPDEMPPVIHPIMYMVLRKWSTFKINEASLIDIILNPSAEMPEDLKEVFPKQGFTYFVNNYKEILKFLLNEYPKTATKSSTELVRYFLNKYESILFCRKLPILHNSLHVITKTGTVRCVDNSVRDALKTALNIAYASFTYRKTVTHEKFIDSSLYVSFQGYVSYVSNIGQHKLGDKHALFRHHLLGCRCHWSGRAVIIPHITPVMADEIYVPWKIMVQSLKLEILNYMVNKYKISPTEAIYRHSRSLAQYDPLIAEIMDTLIDESPTGGLNLLMGRNPSLNAGAIQLLKATKYKPDINDESISVSPMILKAPNGDFDGDELYLIFLKELDAVADFMSMHPSKTMLSSNRPEVSSMVTLLSQTKLMQNNWLMGDPYYQKSKSKVA